MLKEFREFAMRGNVVDLAVGIVIGSAFGKITASLVADIISPPLALLTGSVRFDQLFIAVGEGAFSSVAEATAAGVPTIRYGNFIQTILDFVIIAFAVFFLVRAINRLRRQFEEPAAAPPVPNTKKCPECLSAIPAAARRCSQCTANQPDVGAATG